jgi:hypothetical protein
MDEVELSKTTCLGCPGHHTFCTGCLGDFLKSKIKGNEVPTCMHPKCKYEIQLEEVKHIDRELGVAYDKILLQRAFNQGGFVKCRCDNVMATFDPRAQEQERCDCPKCNYVFCSLCNGDYHYRSTCTELARYRNIWVAWMQQGRINFEQQKRQVEQQTQEYLAAQKKFQEDRTIAIQNLEILRQDEELKAKTSKRCPHCTRVVEKIKGCDAMVRL